MTIDLLHNYRLILHITLLLTHNITIIDLLHNSRPITYYIIVDLFYVNSSVMVSMVTAMA